jgi:hypothetical protein
MNHTATLLTILQMAIIIAQVRKGESKMDNEQCKDCIHRDVCAYKEHYEDVVKLYEKASEEAGKYPWFKFTIYCVKHEVEVEKPRTMLLNADESGLSYADQPTLNSAT